LPFLELQDNDSPFSNDLPSEKEILWESETASDNEVSQKEAECIKELSPRNAGIASVIDRVSSENPLDIGGVLEDFDRCFSYPLGLLTSFFEDVMRWACLKMPHPSLPKAST
jgi:hypothetical protein